MFENRRYRKVASESLIEATKQDGSEQRSAADLEEVVVDADRRQAEQSFPDVRNYGFEGWITDAGPGVARSLRIIRVAVAVAIHFEDRSISESFPYYLPRVSGSKLPAMPNVDGGTITFRSNVPSKDDIFFICWSFAIFERRRCCLSFTS